MGSANVFQASFRRLSGVFQASFNVNLAAAQFWQALVWGTVRGPKRSKKCDSVNRKWPRFRRPSKPGFLKVRPCCILEEAAFADFPLRKLASKMLASRRQAPLSPSPTSPSTTPPPHPTDNNLPWWLNNATRKLLTLRRLMELILPVEQQVHGATPDPTPTLGPPSPQYNVEILARGGVASSGINIAIQHCIGGKGAPIARSTLTMSTSSLIPKSDIVLAEFLPSTISNTENQGRV